MVGVCGLDGIGNVDPACGPVFVVPCVGGNLESIPGGPPVGPPDSRLSVFSGL